VTVKTCNIQISGSSINKHLFGAVRDPNIEIEIFLFLKLHHRIFTK